MVAMPRKIRKNIDENVAAQMQASLKAAVYGTDPSTWFSRYDKDREGHLDYDEFRIMVRIGLKITKELISDADINILIAALDDDDSGTIDIKELADFAERGSATFFEGVDEEFEGTRWGEKHLSDAEKPFEFPELSWMDNLKKPSPLCRYIPQPIPFTGKAELSAKKLLAFIVDTFDKKIIADRQSVLVNQAPPHFPDFIRELVKSEVRGILSSRYVDKVLGKTVQSVAAHIRYVRVEIFSRLCGLFPLDKPEYNPDLAAIPMQLLGWVCDATKLTGEEILTQYQMIDSSIAWACLQKLFEKGNVSKIWLLSKFRPSCAELGLSMPWSKDICDDLEKAFLALLRPCEQHSGHGKNEVPKNASQGRHPKIASTPQKTFRSPTLSIRSGTFQIQKQHRLKASYSQPAFGCSKAFDHSSKVMHKESWGIHIDQFMLMIIHAWQKEEQRVSDIVNQAIEKQQKYLRDKANEVPVLPPKFKVEWLTESEEATLLRIWEANHKCLPEKINFKQNLDNEGGFISDRLRVFAPEEHVELMKLAIEQVKGVAWEGWEWEEEWDWGALTTFSGQEKYLNLHFLEELFNGEDAVLVRSDFLISISEDPEILQHGIPFRRNLPPEAIYTKDEFSSLIDDPSFSMIAVCVPWLSISRPDEGGFHLRILGSLLKEQAKYAKYNGHNLKVGVFIDFMCFREENSLPRRMKRVAEEMEEYDAKILADDALEKQKTPRLPTDAEKLKEATLFFKGATARSAGKCADDFFEGLQGDLAKEGFVDLEELLSEDVITDTVLANVGATRSEKKLYRQEVVRHKKIVKEAQEREIAIRQKCRAEARAIVESDKIIEAEIRARADKESFDRAISILKIVYAHSCISLWCLTKVPDAGVELFEPFDSRGWCILARALASLVKAPSMVFDMGLVAGFDDNTYKDIAGDNNWNWKTNVELVCCGTKQLPPITGTRFREMIKAKGYSAAFTDTAELPRALKLFDEAFEEIITTSTELTYPGNAHWEVRDMKRFSNVLDECKSLMALTISDTQTISDEGFSNIMPSLHHTLETIDFSNSRFGEQSARAYALKNNDWKHSGIKPVLVHLNLGSTVIGDVGLKALLPTLPTTLRYLNLRKSGISDPVMYSLKDALFANLKGVENLDLGGNHKLTDVGVAAVVDELLTCNNLVSLNFDGCINISFPIAKTQTSRKAIRISMACFSDYFLRRKAAVTLKMVEFGTKVGSCINPKDILDCNPYEQLPINKGGNKKDTMPLCESPSFRIYFDMLITGMIPSTKESKSNEKKKDENSPDNGAECKPGEQRKELDLALLSADIIYRTKKKNAARKDIDLMLRDTEIQFYQKHGNENLRAWLVADMENYC